MRIAIVSDIHGNRTAFEAVLADVRRASPDLVFHGGDLADSGSSPADIVDCIRDLGWQGVLGNTDEMLFDPQTLNEFANGSPHLSPLFAAIKDIAKSTRETLGEDRLQWLRNLPRLQMHGPMALVHASPDTAWHAPTPQATDTDLQEIYGPLGQPIAVYAHTHQSYIRAVDGLTVVNTGSVSLSYDGDRRASYLLLDDSKPAIRHVDYDVENEIGALRNSGMPHAEWLAKILTTGRPQMP